MHHDGWSIFSTASQAVSEFGVISTGEPRGGLPLDDWAIVVLAAGRGERMRSKVPKALHRLAGVPLIRHVSEAASAAGFQHQVIVLSPDASGVAEATGTEVATALQDQPLGTGHAALAARAAARGARHVAIINGDLPLVTGATLRAAARAHVEAGALVTVATATVDEPYGYGRIWREGGEIRGIVEENDATPEVRLLQEVNVGVYCARADWLWSTLEGLESGAGGERYLTEIVARAGAAGGPVAGYAIGDADEVRQVNDRVELAAAEQLMRQRVVRRLMLSGVTFRDPTSTWVDASVAVGADTTIEPGVHLLGNTRVGSDCQIGPGALIRDSVVGDRTQIASSTVEGAQLGDEVTVGPYCHLRPGTVLERGVRLGNYVEVKASRIGADARVGHFAYLGDSEIGRAVNIGAGTVTANYDGEHKHRTRVGEGAFIGVDSILIAPVVVGAGARTAAGSVVTHDVPRGAEVLGVPARIRSGKGGETGTA